MEQEELVLAALAAAKGDAHTPVQVQKLLFLIDENIGKDLGGRFFDFQPYDYGPFDKQVYAVIDKLEDRGQAEVIHGGWARRRYRLTEEGQSRGEDILEELGDREREYIKSVSDWVRRLSFSQLVSKIYQKYPHMAERSVFHTS